MSKRFFKLTDDVYLSGRWDLGHPLDAADRKLEDPWQFRVGQRVHTNERIRIPIKMNPHSRDTSRLEGAGPHHLKAHPLIASP
ncbi:hypothetical protein [Myxococcus stipitatus]|uniref:hypothetical protein n=1 Tax=Myxococcus stipitatus TaxID=83455 RepID=UPI0030CEF859